MHYEDSLPPHPADMGRPSNVPEKFWDPQTGAIRTEALLRGYQELERRMHSMVKVPGDGGTDEEVCAFRRALGIPDSPDGYQIETRHELIASDPEINQLLHEHGFTPRQAQLVYDLAHERVLPVIARMNQDHEQRRHMDRLKDHFGGEARWSETARQVSAWGKSNLPPEVYDTLANSAEGVIAMERMMASGEPAMGRAPAPREEALTESELKKMMQDPRYWKTRDPAFIEKVSAGFRRLYGGE